MSRLTRLSLAHRAVVVLLALLIIALGVYAARNLKQELLPNIEIPQASVIATLPGSTPQSIERDVTDPIEDAVRAVDGVTKVTSTTTSGVSQISVQWDYGRDVDQMKSDLQAAVDGLSTQFPTDTETQVVVGNINDFPVVILAVSSSADPAVLARQLNDEAAPRLKQIQGVRDVSITGEEKREVVITLRRKDVDKYGVDPSSLQQIYQANAVAVPAGTVRTGSADIDTQVGTSFSSVKQIRAMRVQGTDGPIALEKIADVAEQPVATTSISRTNGKTSVTVMVTKTLEGNTVTVAQGVREALPEIQRSLGDDATFATVFDQSPFIEQSIHDLTVEGGLGLVMAILVIMAFLLSVRPTLITAVSIPMSLFIALIGLWVGGYTLNILTLGALTAAIGRVVDDSIVVIENIKRHQSLGEHGASSIIAAVKEVAGAVTSSTLTTVAVFLPIGLVGGQAGQIFRPFAVTVTVALLASLLVSLTVVPVLGYWFMGRSERPVSAARAARREARDARVADREASRQAADRARAQAGFDKAYARLSRRKLSPAALAARADVQRARFGLTDGAGGNQHHESAQTWLQRAYLPVLRFALGHRALTLVLAALLFLGSLALTPLLKTDFIGEAGQTSLQITQTLPAGTSLKEMDKAVRPVEAVLGEEPSVETYQVTVGSSQGSESAFFGAADTNVATYSVTLKPKSPGTDVAAQLREQIDRLPDAGVVEVVVGGGSNNLEVLVQGTDPEKLAEANDQVVAMMRTVPGVSNISSDLTAGRKQFAVDVDEKAAAAIGITQAQIGASVAQAISGQRIGGLARGDSTLDVILRGQRPVRSAKELREVYLPVTQKQTMDAQKKAGDKVTEDQEAMADAQKADAEKAYNKQLDQLRESRRKAADGLDELTTQLAELERALAAPVPTPVVQAPPDPKAQIRAQIAQVKAAITSSREQIKALDDQYDQAVEQHLKQQNTQSESDRISQAAKDAQKAKGKAKRLYQVADVHVVDAAAQITHVDGNRSATVTATPTGTDLGATSTALQTGLASLHLPAGVTATVGGVSQEQSESFAQLGLAMLVAIAVVYMIMVGTFGSLLQPLILLVSIPFAATGAIGLLLATDTALGLPSMIGLLMLIGIVVTNAIVLIDLVNTYQREGASIDEALLHGARLRLRPIVMTALATICALTPMALGITGGGVFISKPLAIVVIGGLISSTLLTLILVPVLYDIVEKIRLRLGPAQAPREAQHAVEG